MADQKTEPQQMQVNLNLDTTPILYTDNIFMTSNEDGLVLDVCQKGNVDELASLASLPQCDRI